MDSLAIVFFGYLIRGLVFGLIAQHIATSKGYDTGFAWGFWLGLIGILVVAVKPEIVTTSSQGQRSQYWRRLSGALPEPEKWRCVCGQENADGLQYCTKCRRTREEGTSKAPPKVECRYCGAKNNRSNAHCFACGRSLKEQSVAVQENATEVSSDAVNLDAIKKLAELRDMGILTEEEFQEKKTSILAKI